MPDITAMLPVRIHHLTRGLDRRAPITDGGVPVQSAIMGQPQRQSPPGAIHGPAAFGGPAGPTARGDQVQLRPLALVCVAVIQRQRARGWRRMGRHPIEGAARGRRPEGRKRPAPAVLPGPGAPAGLELGLTGLPRDQHGPNLARGRAGRGSAPWYPGTPVRAPAAPGRSRHRALGALRPARDSPR